MITLNRRHLKKPDHTGLTVPDESMFSLPEKILQFGTGVLLRGLPDYYIDQANRNRVFGGRIVAVKSTSAGPLQPFYQQEGLYSLTLRGLSQGQQIAETIIVSSISRVLAASSQWQDVLACAVHPEIRIVISNTTEEGIKLLEEDIHQSPPLSFPAKLLACLYQRYQALGNTDQSELIVLPTELIPDNGKVLQNIVEQLAAYNGLDRSFVDWMNGRVSFCNTLVDRIVPGSPDAATKHELEGTLGYHDDLWITAEPYNLWAIEGDQKIADALSFHASNEGIVITPDITLYREIKLRLLNGTHTLCCGAAFLSGIETVHDAATHPVFSSFIRGLMLEEIAKALPYPVAENVVLEFAEKTFERFCNPYIRHLWLNITTGYTTKLRMRVLPVLLKYYELHETVPEKIAYGVAAYLLFMKATQHRNDQFLATCRGNTYPIKDDHAGYFFDLWEQYSSNPDKLTEAVLSNKKLWGVDLTVLPGFSFAVKENLKNMIADGIS